MSCLLWFDVKALYGWKSHILAAIKEVSIFYFSEINPFLGVTVVWDKRACFSILKCKRINNKQEVNSTNHNHNVFLIDHKNKICRLHPERIFSFLLSRRNMFVMSMGITVSYHINNIECTPLHIFPNPQATSNNMRLCTAFCWKSLLPLETCDWVNLYCQNSSHH